MPGWLNLPAVNWVGHHTNIDRVLANWM